MIPAKGYAAQQPKKALASWDFERREPGPKDVQFDILFCGVCHSDIHQIRDEWGEGAYPMVPGHEIVGKVTRVGADVKKFKVGDLAAVGCLVDSCRTCDNCQSDLEQFCLNGGTFTYNSLEQDKKTRTYGGYSNRIVVNEHFVMRVSDHLSLPAVAPLLCAGITTYSPLRHWKVGKGHQVAILGLGGLGHMGVKFAAAFGAEVTMLSSSPAKETDAKRLGAHHFILTRDPKQVEAVKGKFDFILDTVSAPHDLNLSLGMLNTDGVHICVGIPPTPLQLEMFSLIHGRKSLVGSMIGGMAETQEMLDYCAAHGIVSDIELIPIQDINKAFERMVRGDVRYRFVIDMATL